MASIDTLAAGSWLLEHGALPAGTTLRAVIGEQRYARVSAAANELGAPSELLDGQAPWVVALELADLEYVHLGFDPQHGVEEQLVGRAQSDGKATAGLETLDQELGGLAALPAADQLRLLDQTLSELQDAPQELDEVLTAWRRGDATKLAELLYSEYRSFPALYRLLVGARNQRWLPADRAAGERPGQLPGGGRRAAPGGRRRAARAAAQGRLRGDAAQLSPQRRAGVSRWRRPVGRVVSRSATAAR